MTTPRDPHARDAAGRPFGDLPAQIQGLSRRFRLRSLQTRHNSRAVLGAYVLVTSAISIGILSSLAALTDQPFVFPSLGPTAFLLFYAALGTQSAPRNVFCGHLIGVLAGYLGLLLFGLTAVGPDLEDVTWPRVGAVTVALCLTLSLMVWLKTPHAPAGATTLIVALGLMRTPEQLLILMVAVVLMILQGLAINRLAGLPYPLWGSGTDDDVHPV
jgi:CBS-domain-containing membrane protein